MTRSLRRLYGRAGRIDAWRPGDAAQTTIRIPPDLPSYVPVTVEEVRTFRGARRKDAFGDWKTHGGGTRVRVGYGGKSYWVDADVLERP